LLLPEHGQLIGSQCVGIIFDESIVFAIRLREGVDTVDGLVVYSGFAGRGVACSVAREDLCEGDFALRW